MTCTIIVSRERRSVLKRVAAHLLIQSRTVTYFNGDTDRWELPAGEVTLMLLPDKVLTFELKEGETRRFVILEGLFEAGYLVRLLASVILITVFWYGALTGWRDSRIMTLLAMAYTFVQVKDLIQRYFILEEVVRDS